MLVVFQVALNVNEASDVMWFHPLDSYFATPHVKLTMVDVGEMGA